MTRSMLAVVFALAVGCAAPPADVSAEASQDSGPIVVGAGEAELRAAFNAASAGRQLVVILSPT